MTNHKIVVLVPFRNIGHYIIDCVNSLLNQQYDNYEAYLLDDQSDDNTLDLIDEEFDQIHKLRNEKRLGPMENIAKALINLPLDDEDIVVLLDGDDFIFGEYAFRILNEQYNSNILLTFGQYIDNFGRIGHCSAYTKDEFNNLRKSTWKASHPKTFKYKLFKAFLGLDPNLKSLKFDDGRFFMASSDMGIMIPLMEVAGYENVCFISNVLYCYRLHENNDHVSDRGRKLQLDAEYCIRNRIPLTKENFI